MAEVRSVPKRSEVPEEFTWNLCDLYETDDKWLEALKKAKSIPEKLASYEGKLAASAETLLEYFRLDDEITLELNRLANYAMRKYDQDTAEPKYQDFYSKMMMLYQDIGASCAYAVPEIISIPDETLDSFYKTCPDLELYRISINRIRIEKDHVLSAAEEAILAMSQQVRGVPDDVYGTLESTDLKFPSAVDSEGNEHPLTNGSYVALVENPDRELRKDAFKKLYGTYEQFKNTFASLYFGEVKQSMFMCRTKKYNSTLEMALSANEVPTSVYHNLIDAVHSNMGYMHKYMSLRKKLMGVDELHMYDLYTTLVPDADAKVTYEDSKKDILDAMQILGDDYVSMLKEGFDNRWVDVYENEGKRSGAYSAGARPHPYVLMNHKENLDSEFTLVHEMGHSLHSYLSQKNQPVCYSDYVIFVAEVASTCNEALLMQYLLSKTTDKKERAYLINYFLEQFRTTLYRQTMFAEFELLTKEAAERGETLNADYLCDLYYKLNKQYYGDDITVDPEIAFEWERIPHFYYNYYVYQYATGFSAAIALSQKIIKEGESAVKNYLKFLSCGSITDPISLLKIAGVDMNSPEPINDALKMFGDLIDELDELLG